MSLSGMSPIRVRSWLPVALQAAAVAGANAWLWRQMRSDKARFSLHARRLYNLDTLLVPAVLAATAPVLRPKVRAAALGVAAACVSARIYATHIEPRRLLVRRLRLVSPKISRPVRIVHLTDMETDSIGRHEEKVMEKLRRLNPDVVFHTGDLLGPQEPATYDSELPGMQALWEGIEPPLGKWTVIGEVDRPIRSELCAGVGGLQALIGEKRLLEASGLRLNVFGLSFRQSTNDDPERTRQAVSDWLREAGPGDFTILLGHRPDFILSVHDQPIDLCLAGHTHGGQVRIPFFGPIETNSKVPDSWSIGFHQIGRTRLNVSAGVGFEHGHHFPELRINCPPEMTLIELVPLGSDLQGKPREPAFSNTTAGPTHRPAGGNS